MEAFVSKKVKKISDPHVRFATYLDLVELISGVYGEEADPQSNYVVVIAESEDMIEEKYFGNQPVDEIKEYLKRVKITEIENSIPGSFAIGGRLWYMNGEGVTMYGNEVSLFCYDIDAGELRNLQKLVRKSARDYAVEFAGKRIIGGG